MKNISKLFQFNNHFNKLLTSKKLTQIPYNNFKTFNQNLIFQNTSINKVNKYQFSNNISYPQYEINPELQKTLKSINVSNQNIIDSKIVLKYDFDKNTGKVNILVRIDKKFPQLKQIIISSLKQEVSWVQNVEVKLAPKDQTSKYQEKGGLKDVKNIIAVSSCKGGVGKSTVAINLALSLQKNFGLKVGLFDADIYGPSLPTLVNKEKQSLQSPDNNPNKIVPLDYKGMKIMSNGFVNHDQSVLRGPLVSSIVSQLIYQTEWEDLDYLIIDMPPGTGDVQITLCQEIAFTAAVIVTTPQKLSFIDVVKGIEMFDDLRVPTVSIVENMSKFKCNNCGKVHHPFGNGYLNTVKQEYGIKNSYEIPISNIISKCSDKGTPFVYQDLEQQPQLDQEQEIQETYKTIAENLQNELKNIQNQKIPIVRYQTGTQEIIIQENGSDKIINRIKASDLRKQCQCSICIDEFTGEKLINIDKISEDVYPHKIIPKGNYAVQLQWNDGHQTSIFSYKRLETIKGLEEQQDQKQ